MPVKLNIPLPSKGLVVDRPGEFVDTRSLTNTWNMDVRRNLIQKRAGTVAIGASLGERIMRYFELVVGNTTRLIRVGLTEVEALNKATSTWSSVTASALTGTTSDPVSFTFPLLSGAKVAVFTNGVDAIRKIGAAGNDASLGGTPPKAKYVRAIGPYLVLGHIIDGGNTYYSRVQWSDTGDPETWSGGNAGSIDLVEDPGDITGLGLFGNHLAVHKNESIYIGQLVTTEDVFRFDRRPTGVGTAAEATIANLPTGEHVFLAHDGIHSFDGSYAPLIEAPIQEEIRDSINPSAIHLSCGMVLEEISEYWCAVPIGDSDVPSTIYKYNWKTGQVYKDLRTNMTAMSFYIDTSEATWDSMYGTWDSQSVIWDSVSLQTSNKRILFGDSSGNSTYKVEGSSSDSGAALSANFETKDFNANDFGLPDMDTMMRWKGLEMWAVGGTVTIEYSTDGGESWVLVGTQTLQSYYPTDASPINVYFDVVSSRMRFRFSNTTANETFTIKKYQIEATPREVRK